MTNMFSFKLSPDLADAVRLRSVQVGYSSLAGYIKGLIRKDMAANECHDEALAWSALSWVEQDGIDARLLAQVKAVEVVAKAHAVPVDAPADEPEALPAAVELEPVKDESMEWICVSCKHHFWRPLKRVPKRCPKCSCTCIIDVNVRAVKREDFMPKLEPRSVGGLLL